MLQLYNTLSGKKEIFVPLNNESVKIFACGPSIYQPPHIGNYRTFIYEDVLVRYLRHCGFKVHHVTILTDIEDKAIEEAKRKNVPLGKLTEQNAQRFFKESKELSIAVPTTIARSSTTVDSAILIIEKLLEKGIAYFHGENIYFDVHAFPEFGKLFKIDISSWPRRKFRFSRDTYPGRRWNKGDFILWHSATNADTISFSAPFGGGRPSWNVQDPAAIIKHLGEQIDINCGGIDNIYRHHDYNIAVMESYTGKRYARYFLHGEHLLVNGKTMSKSRGNIVYPEDVYKKGFKPHHLRFFLMSKHYRTKLNFSEKNFLRAVENIDQTRAMVRKIFTIPSKSLPTNKTNSVATEILHVFKTAMDDDLDVPSAFKEVSKIVKSIVQKKSTMPLNEVQEIRNAIYSIDDVLKVLR